MGIWNTPNTLSIDYFLGFGRCDKMRLTAVTVH